MPTKTALPQVKQIVKARWRRRLGPVQIAGELGEAEDAFGQAVGEGLPQVCQAPIRVFVVGPVAAKLQR